MVFYSKFQYRVVIKFSKPGVYHCSECVPSRVYRGFCSSEFVSAGRGAVLLEHYCKIAAREFVLLWVGEYWRNKLRGVDHLLDPGGRESWFARARIFYLPNRYRIDWLAKKCYDPLEPSR